MNIRTYVTESFRLVGALATGLAILALIWAITPKQDKTWCDTRGMDCYNQLATRR